MMDWKTFISEIIGHVTWPVALVVIVIIIRKPSIKLLSFLTKVKYKDLEVEFSQAVKELKVEAERVSPKSEDRQPIIDKQTSDLDQLAEIAPRAAVIEAWRRVESAASDCIQKYDNKKEDVYLKSAASVWPSLLREKIINESQMEIMKELKKLRNMAVHSDEFSFGEDDAKNYILSAIPLVVYLKSYE